MIQYYNINGSIVQASNAMLKVNDLAILRGYGVFDFFLVRDGVPMYVDDYVARFERSAGLLNLDLPLSKSLLKEKIRELIQSNGLMDAAIRLVLTGGYADDGYIPVEPNLLIMEHLMPTYKDEVMTQGVKVLLHQHMRELPEAKTINYLTGIRLAGNMKQKGAIEILYHNGIFVYEGVRSNFFIVDENGTIATPKDQVLLGITRKNTLEIARQHFTVEERNITPSELLNAKEVFLTSTTKGAMPVVQIDDQIIGDGKPGKVTLQLAKLLQEHDKAYIKRVKVEI